MRVIKVGGRIQRDPALPSSIAVAWCQAPGTLCLVHGGGDEISALQRRLGVQTTYVNGRRVTTAADLELIRMSLSGLANKRLVSALADIGIAAVGISGEDGRMLVGARIGALGHAALPASVDCTLPRALLAAGYLPVISPVARDASGGGAVNVNGDDAACALAAALGAEELLLISDVPAVLVEGEPCDVLDVRQARHMIKNGEATGGMVAKLEAACSALAAGVPAVRIGGIEAIGNPSSGTCLRVSERAKVPA